MATEIKVLDTMAELRAAIDRTRRTIQSGDLVRKFGEQLAREVLKTVVQLTPSAKYRHDAYSQRRDGRPLKADWEIKVDAAIRREQFRAIVSNSAADDDAGKVILLALEGGARPHAMPKSGDRTKDYVFRADSMRFKFLGRSTDAAGILSDKIEDRGGGKGLIRTKQINHPGHKPFHMVNRTVAHADSVAAAIELRVANEIEAAWAASFAAGVKG